LAGGSASGTTHSSSFQCASRPVSHIAGTKIADTSHSDGNRRRRRRPTARTPERSNEDAISEPPSANISDIAGRNERMVHPDVW
jgi:hypothetical protein